MSRRRRPRPPEGGGTGRFLFFWALRRWTGRPNQPGSPGDTREGSVAVALHGRLRLEGGRAAHAVGGARRQLEAEAQVGRLVEQHGHVPSLARLWYFQRLPHAPPAFPRAAHLVGRALLRLLDWLRRLAAGPRLLRAAALLAARRHPARGVAPGCLVRLRRAPGRVHLGDPLAAGVRLRAAAARLRRVRGA